MNWYQKVMPTIRDVVPILKDVKESLGVVVGVKNVYAWGSVAKNLARPHYIVKDIDIIAETNFDSGDLLAIENNKMGALHMRPSDLEDFGFNPQAVAFTKTFLTFAKFNVDHWVTTKDDKLLHWGAIPDSQEEWEELHQEAEKLAEKETSLTRKKLTKASEEQKKSWKHAYDSHINLFLAKNVTGWFPSEHSAKEILKTAKKI